MWFLHVLTTMEVDRKVETTKRTSKIVARDVIEDLFKERVRDRVASEFNHRTLTSTQWYIVRQGNQDVRRHLRKDDDRYFHVVDGGEWSKNGST